MVTSCMNALYNMHIKIITHVLDVNKENKNILIQYLLTFPWTHNMHLYLSKQ